MALLTIPVDSINTYYTLDTVLDGESYTFTVRWNSTSETWYIDIEGNNVKLIGIALLPGTDLLKPYAILEMGSLYIQDASNTQQNPSRYTLGDPHYLVYIPRGETIEGLLSEL